MKNIDMRKVTSFVVAAALITGTVSTVSYRAGMRSVALAPSPEVTAEAATAVTNEISATSTDAIKSIIDDQFEAGKEETVYVLASADGSVNKIIVSDWLKNPGHDKTIEDATELKDIENVKGDEAYTINPDNMKVWQADGNDIYYQGTSDNALPVDVAISYKLDGKTVTAEEAAGKSGRLTMRFDYTNNEYETVSIDGKDEKIYVPFVMITGMIVDDGIFSNITVSNGKVINDGDKSVIMGFALPGMQETLGINKEEIEIPSYVEISADVKDFALTTTMTLATNDMFNKLDLTNVKTAEELEKSLDTLSSSSLQLVDGSSALYDGLELLLTKSGELVDGVKQLYDGAKALDEGASELATGASELSKGANDLKKGAKTLDSGAIDLKTGAKELRDGLKQISDNSKSLNDGAKQVFESLLATADSQLKTAGLSVPKLTIDNYKTTLNAVAADLSEEKVRQMAYNTALAQVTAAVNENRDAVKTGVTAVVKATVLQAVIDSAGLQMNIEQYEQAVAAGQIPNDVAATINATVEAKMASDDIKSTISIQTEAKLQELINTNMQSAEVTSKIDAAVKSAKEGAGSIQNLISQLDSYKQFYDGVLSYTAGVDKAYAGSKTLASGAKELQGGASQLADGTKTLASGAKTLSLGADELSKGTLTLFDGAGKLKDGAGALIDGETELYQGSQKLAAGMKEFNEKGIKKLVAAVNGDVKELATRMKAAIDVSKDYQSYGGKSDKVNGTVKFIYRTDSIE